METKREFYKMIAEKRRLIKSIGVSNCIGTVLYLVGEQTFDEKGDSFSNPIQSWEISKEPVIGYVIEWYDKNNVTFHAGVISGINPLSVFHREKNRGLYHSSQDIGKIREENLPFLKKQFRIPSKLQKILDKENK